MSKMMVSSKSHSGCNLPVINQPGKVTRQDTQYDYPMGFRSQVSPFTFVCLWRCESQISAKQCYLSEPVLTATSFYPQYNLRRLVNKAWKQDTKIETHSCLQHGETKLASTIVDKKLLNGLTASIPTFLPDSVIKTTMLLMFVPDCFQWSRLVPVFYNTSILNTCREAVHDLQCHTVRIMHSIPRSNWKAVCQAFEIPENPSTTAPIVSLLRSSL
jgi:hypothetical protein